MSGARLVHDTLEQQGWDVEIADAQKVKGLAPLACKTDKIDSMVLAVLSHRDPVPAIWLPDPHLREERELARFRLHLVKHRTTLKYRVRLRWALIETTMHALKHPAYAKRYQRNKRRLGKQRGAKVAQIEIARRLAHAIWHRLSRNQMFAPRGLPSPRRGILGG